MLASGYIDLLPIVQQNESSEIHIHFGGNHPEDAEAAERLRGLPNVTLHPHDFDGHNIGGWLKNNGQLDAALAPIFESAPAFT